MKIVKIIHYRSAGTGRYVSKINNSGASLNELSTMISEEKVKWGDHVPKLNIFSQETMSNLLKNNGFSIEDSYGVPVFVRPGPEDWDPTNTLKSKISENLENKDFYNKVLEIEMSFNSIPEVVNRGMNIFTVAKK